MTPEQTSAVRGIEVLDLNADVGERSGADGLRLDAAILESVTSANVACGGHAGDASMMRALCELAVSRGVAIGAQVSYVDRPGFGRTRLDVPHQTLVAQIQEQWTALSEAAELAGTSVAYMRPHGALYNAAATDQSIAEAVVLATPPGTPVLCLEGSALSRAAHERGHDVVHEVFADRSIHATGLLVDRDRPGAVLTSATEVVERLVEWIDSGAIRTITRTRWHTSARSICLHSDTPGSESLAAIVRSALERRGVTLRPFAVGSEQ